MYRFGLHEPILHRDESSPNFWSKEKRFANIHKHMQHGCVATHESICAQHIYMSLPFAHGLVLFDDPVRGRGPGTMLSGVGSDLRVSGYELLIL